MWNKSKWGNDDEGREREREWERGLKYLLHQCELQIRQNSPVVFLLLGGGSLPLAPLSWKNIN